MMMGNQYNDSVKGILSPVFPRHQHLLIILIMVPKYTGSCFRVSEIKLHLSFTEIHVRMFEKVINHVFKK